MVEANNDSAQFKWGIKRDLGGPNKDDQFYASFTFNGVHYRLYDCVCLDTKEENWPYVGKIIDIWEQADGKKKVKLLWFFYSIEILYYIGDCNPMEKELFIASGEGVGLADINPLEAISAKCSIICTSDDPRNPQPSKNDLENADFVFYRTFDVGPKTISDNLPDKIAGIEVEALLNRKDLAVRSFPRFSNPEANDSDRKSEDNEAKIDEPVEYIQNVHQTEATTNNNSVAIHVDDKIISCERNKMESDMCDDAKPLKKMRLSDNPKNILIKSAVDDTSENLVDSAEKKCKKDDKITSCNKKKVKSDFFDVVKPLKKLKLSDDPKMVLIKSDVDDFRKSLTQLCEEGSKNNKLIDKVKPSDESLRNLPLVESTEKFKRADYQMMEVTRQPNVERSKWFRGLPWDTRLQKAHEQGTLIFLWNFDRTFSSTDIEDIICSICKQTCSAKIIPSILPYHNPQYGQAYVIFKTQDAANYTTEKINMGCLKLPNGSTFLASKGLLKTPPKATTLPGHLVINKSRISQREEMRNAVSTSHCSQPNTIEYEMAMEWLLLQERSAKAFKQLYKDHGDDRKKVEKKLKTNK